MSKTKNPEILHSRERWQDGEREPIFTIVTPLWNEDGTPTMIADPSFVSESPDQVTAEIQATSRTEYTIPAKPNAGMALAYLKRARVEGANSAMAWILEEALGEAGYDALAGEPDTDPALLEELTAQIVQRALGGLEAPKGS